MISAMRVEEYEKYVNAEVGEEMKWQRRSVCWWKHFYLYF